MSRERRVVSPRGGRGMERTVDRLGVLASNPIFYPHIAAAAENTATNKRRFTIRVRDQDTRDRLGYFVVRIWIATAANGGPAGTQTFTLVTGTTIQTITADRIYDLMTDEEGRIEFDVEVSGAGTRYVYAVMMGKVYGTEAVTWV